MIDIAADVDKAEPTKNSVLNTIRAVSKWKNLAGVYGTDENVQKAEGMLSEIERLLEACGAEVKKRPAATRSGKSMYSLIFRRNRPPDMFAELFKKKPEAFKNLATAEDLLLLTRVYNEYFNDIPDDDGPLIEPHSLLPFDLEDADGGDMGMEVECTLDPTTLATALGFSRRKLPYQYNELRHLSGLTPWSDKQLFDTKPRPDCLVNNELHWHQLAGVHSIVRNTFTATPDPNHCTGVLVADEVGLGKTAQSISVIAFLNHCIFLQENGMELPSVLGESLSCVRASIGIFTSVLDGRRFLGGKDTIEPLPHLIVTPGTLRNQWIRELQSLFRPHSVDIFVYDCPKAGNPAFWKPDGEFYSSRQKPQNKIIFTTHSVCSSLFAFAELLTNLLDSESPT